MPTGGCHCGAAWTVEDAAPDQQAIEQVYIQLDYIGESLSWFLQARDMTPGVQVWYFEDSGDAYDACMSRECIDDGDVLVIAREGVVGVLMSAWPAAVTREPGAFHLMEDGCHMNTTDEGKYCRSYELACAIAQRNGFTVA